MFICKHMTKQKENKARQDTTNKTKQKEQRKLKI